MSATIELKATTRAKVGKGAARSVRREGLTPAVIYGAKEPAVPIALGANELRRHIVSGHFLTTIFEIDVEGTKTRVIPRDFQLDPVKDFPIHVDFLRVTAGAKVSVLVPVEFINDEASPGLKRGGALNVVRHEIEVNAPADAIPDAIVVDLTGTNIGDSIHISRVALPVGVTPTITDRDFTIATISASAGAREDAAAATAAAEEARAEESAEED